MEWVRRVVPAGGGRRELYVVLVWLWLVQVFLRFVQAVVFFFEFFLELLDFLLETEVTVGDF